MRLHAIHSRRFGMLALFIAAGTAALLGCKPNSPRPSPSAAGSAAATPAKKARFVVYTSFYPLSYFAERIGGKHVEVVCPCPADADPAYWMPSPEVIGKFQNADLILINGAQFEKWVDKASLPSSALVDTTSELTDELITLPKAVTHSHGPAGTHTHEGIDGHTWLDPVNAKAQAEAVLDALCARYPAPTDEFHANFDKLAADLDKLAARAATISARLEGQTLAASHPAYNYLARRNGWQIQNFTLDPETPLEPADWENLRGGLSAMPVIVMLWEAEPLEETSKMLFDDQGLTSVVFSPAETLAPEQRAKGEDYLTIMNANFGRLEDALGTATVPMSDEPVDE